MKLTKKQRGEIYLKVAERVQESWNSFLCIELNIHCDKPRLQPLSELFPEFELFNPMNPDYRVWFNSKNLGTNNHEFQKDCRVICMLFCHYMTQS